MQTTGNFVTPLRQAQINCGLCPQIVKENPGTVDVIEGLQDSMIIENYFKGGLNFAISAAIFTPALRGEVQISPSMRRLTSPEDEIGSKYANQNVSVFLVSIPFNWMNLLAGITWEKEQKNVFGYV